MKKNSGCQRQEPMNIEMQKQIREVARCTSLEAHAIISISLSHAIRVSEICGLRRDDISLKENTIRIRRLKNSLTTIEKLAPSEIEVIRELLASVKGDLLFPVSRWTVYRLFRSCAEAAGLPESCRAPHSGKHTVLQNCCDSGASLPQLLAIGGHKHASSGLRYYQCRQSQADEIRLRVLAATA